MINISDFKDPNDQQGRTYREVNNAKKHKYKVGQLVELDNGVRLFVAMKTRDCDGTPLYCLTPELNDTEQDCPGFANLKWINGICEGDIHPIENETI